MSKQPMGKTLLRNVIRQTDAHNKIQEQMEMWKMRDWEIQTSNHKRASDTERTEVTPKGHMHCDRMQDQTRNRNKERDDGEARYWTRKLYEFEARDPDRWGHSGFKELYPDEFKSDREKEKMTKKLGRHKMKKSKSDTEARLSKHSNKSSRKKKRKKGKKEQEEKQKKAKCSSSCDSSPAKDRQGRKRTKNHHKDKKSVKTRRDVDSSSGDSDDGQKRRRTHSCKKRKHDSRKDSDSGPNSNTKRRKNWKAAGGESSDDGSP